MYQERDGIAVGIYICRYAVLKMHMLMNMVLTDYQWVTHDKEQFDEVQC